MNTSVHYHLGGLGAACGTGASLVNSMLATAAGVDPEPISKAILSVGSLIDSFFGHPDCNKIATTQIVNQAEGFLKQNLAAWQSLPASQKTLANQQAALQVFDSVWNQVLQACGSGKYGSAGAACIADRQQGGCHYQVNGQCWNWFVGYRDPIANDPQVAMNAASNPIGSILPASVTSALASTGIDPTILLIGGGLLILVMLL